MTTIRHHPTDDMLVALAAGTLPAGPAAVLACHVETCPACAGRLMDLEALGGALLEELPDAGLAPEALALTLAAIDAPAAPRVAPASPARRARGHRLSRPELPAGAHWPRALDGCSATPWRWIGPGMRWSRLHLPQDPAANVFLLRIGAGKFLPPHTHSELELTQVLWGSFHDGRALFGPGDFDAADGDIHHQPVVQAGSECICLASVDGRVVFDSFLARTLGSLVGM
ncbi:ChrR family anti-sigma-E factor [Pseudacidovorax sp. NFM-22]|uniref:ChrR family anti-sigma-E factor n=1 Tax=Pseudacidovorax sp. NFM-22 TaxID=2744469 RepID=UPI001F387E67|nr:ChrR family anti-sigma-E factor [Pseudacidovorax sp. NFM-22]